MARRFAKISEEEIKTAFFYPSDLVNTKTTIPPRVGGYIPRRFASRYISTTIHLPLGDSCILAELYRVKMFLLAWMMHSHKEVYF